MLAVSQSACVAQTLRHANLGSRRPACFNQQRLVAHSRKNSVGFGVSPRVARTKASASQDDLDNPRHPTSSAIEKYGSVFEFFKIEATIRTWRLDYVAEALIGSGIRGMTAYSCKGIGFQKGSRYRMERNKGVQYGESDFVDKVKIEVVVVKEQVDEVIELISDSVATGEYGDGKIFVLPVIDLVRIRTGEHGFAAERMSGGMQDMSS